MPSRPHRRRLGTPAPRLARRRPLAVVALALVAAALLGAVAAVSIQDRDAAEVPRAPKGEIYRAQYLIMRLGTSRTNVRSQLGPPRTVRRTAGRDCWIYDPRLGRRGIYEFCFTGNFLSGKATAPR